MTIWLGLLADGLLWRTPRSCHRLQWPEQVAHADHVIGDYLNEGGIEPIEGMTGQLADSPQRINCRNPLLRDEKGAMQQV
jgi:hypothetical protein